jgi:hypothetical protein
LAGAKRDITNSGLYDRLDSLRLEVKQDISVAVTAVAQSQGRLEKKFDDLEAGRLTRLEGKYNDLSIRMIQYQGERDSQASVVNFKTATLWTISLAILLAAANVGIGKLWK